jgi:nucleoside phosphorylase
MVSHNTDSKVPMSDTRPFDLFTFVQQMTTAAEWIEEISIFGSRRYSSNASYGSDIDLLIVPNRSVATDVLRKACEDPYVDPFLVDGELAISAVNETRIRLGGQDKTGSSVDAVQIWTRAKGWRSGNDYRILQILPDRIPATTIGTWGARPILLFCALPSEYDAVVRRLPGGKPNTHKHLPLHYVAHLTCKTGEKQLIVVAQTGVASVQAGISAARMLNYFDRSLLAILVGITAALRERNIALGDILLPRASEDVESGKKTPKGKEPAGLTFNVQPYFHSALASWSGIQQWQEKWQTDLSGATTMPAVHDDCILACTASVIAYNKEAQSYRTINRKIVGIEMEAVGIGTATQSSGCPFLIVKSVSDWADEEKDDRWHQYCADVAADLVVSALENEIFWPRS